MPRPAMIRQPGPASAPRIIAVPTRGRRVMLDLAEGLCLIDAIGAAFARHGAPGGVVDIAGLRLDPVAYVAPALSATPDHAAYYSETFRPAGGITILSGAITFGRRDGAPFFHAHAIWREADGAIQGGHLLPDQCFMPGESQCSGFALLDALFEAIPDPETNFALFRPGPLGDVPPAAPNALALRLKPNQDVHAAIEAACRAAGFAAARIHGGVGSLIGADFDDAPEVANFATEVFIKAGDVRPDATGAPVCTLSVGLVDYTRALAEGRLARSRPNPVLMTFELVLERLDR